jgi:hypothetical protein
VTIPSTPVTNPPSAGGVPGYLRTLKTLAVDAIRNAFEVTYPVNDSAGGVQLAYCSLEYPVAAANYPGIWVTYAPAQLQTAGIDYTERDSTGNIYVRSRFSGTISFTVSALTNNERDLFYDQLVSILMFSAQSDIPSPFRTFVESSNLIEVTFSYDTLDSSGHGETLGTPWGTDEVIYEDGIAIQVTGEFTVSPSNGQLQPVYHLREIIVSAYQEGPGGTVAATPTWMAEIDENAQNNSIPGI